jgi:hypothetical protein
MESDHQEQNQADQNTQMYQSQCLLSFRAHNSASCSKTLELSISPRFDEEGKPIWVNFRMPEAPILCEVFSSSNTFVIHLTKLDPAVEAWGAFDWSFKVVEKNVGENAGDAQQQ